MHHSSRQALHWLLLLLPPVTNMQATSRDQKWVALPHWKALALARHPVAIPLENCAAEPSVLAASRAKVGCNT
jgi:hypothetical protein